MVSGLYNVNPDEVRPADNYRTYAPDYGTISQIYNGLEMNISARLRNGLQLQAGTSTGQQVTDNCEVRSKLPEQTGGFSTGERSARLQPDQPVLPQRPGQSTRVTAAGSYTIPKIDVLLSGDVPERPGVPLAANCDRVQRRRGAVARAGRWSNNAPNVTVNLLEPGEMYVERVNQLDFRVGKILRFGRQRANVSRRPVQRVELRHDPRPTTRAFIPGGRG